MRRTTRETGAVLRYVSFLSPLGWLLIAAKPQGISLVSFSGAKEPSPDECRDIIRRGTSGATAESDPACPSLMNAMKAVSEYFDKGVPVPPLPLDMAEGTPFQRLVWEAIGKIPFGETRSYMDIARAVGRPGASRAVGRACGANPLPIIIPCHRVVGAGGKLGGYTGGIHIKETLLQLEAPRASPG